MKILGRNVLDLV